MKLTRRPLLGLAMLLCPLAAWTAEPAAAPAPAAPAAQAAQLPAAAPSTPAPPARAASAVPGPDVPGREPIEPNVQHIVVEGENTRIEELRVRGQTQSVVVKNKGAPSYEIVIGDGSRDLSSDGGAQRGAAGQRVWRLLSF